MLSENNNLQAENSEGQKPSTGTTLAKEIINLRNNQEILKSEISEQREYLLHLVKQVKKIRRYILFNFIGEMLKLLLILLPLIIAFFALKPYFGQVADALKNLQETANSLGGFNQLLK